jgi:hypothetical protein
MRQRTPLLPLLIALILPILSITACQKISKSELNTAHATEDALCKAVVDCYRGQNLKVFSQLALSPKQIERLMATVKLPESARQEEIKHKKDFTLHIQDSLSTVLRLAEVDWQQAQYEKFVPLRKPIIIADGYKMTLGKLRIVAGDIHLDQPFTIVELNDGKYYVGDFGPFERKP